METANLARLSADAEEIEKKLRDCYREIQTHLDNLAAIRALISASMANEASKRPPQKTRARYLTYKARA